jgi:hypothetical protein
VPSALLNDNAKPVIPETGPPQEGLELLNILDRFLNGACSDIDAAWPNLNRGCISQEVIIISIDGGALEQ